MKTTISFRCAPELRDQFAAACKAAGEDDASRVLRELVRASLVYMENMGRWWPCQLVPQHPEHGRRKINQPATQRTRRQPSA